MLKHEDHIFTNLNGYNSFKLNEAKSRGVWNDTKKIIQRGSSWLINEIHLTFFLARISPKLIRENEATNFCD